MVLAHKEVLWDDSMAASSWFVPDVSKATDALCGYFEITLLTVGVYEPLQGADSDAMLLAS